MHDSALEPARPARRRIMPANPDRSTLPSLPGRELTAWILKQRPAREPIDPFKPQGFFTEAERNGSGRIVNSATILLTNKECPWRCLMCDLWKHTLTHAVPGGAIAQQINHALSQLDSRPEQIKLYNSGSFFDAAAVPPADYPDIARSVAFAAHVIVESHPRLVGTRTLPFRDLLLGSLEVALGLETVHPEVLPRLNKKFTLTHFEQAANFLQKNGIALRAFVLVKPPFLDEAAGLEWAVKSVAFAVSCGATVVSLIPTRPGNGAMEQLMETGDFSPPQLSLLERTQESALGLRSTARIFADTWDLEQFSRCPTCFDARRRRIRTMNLFQQIPPAVNCPVCSET